MLELAYPDLPQYSDLIVEVPVITDIYRVFHIGHTLYLSLTVNLRGNITDIVIPI